METLERSRKPIDLTDARDVITIVCKHKYLILVTFLVISIGTTIYALTLPRLFEAKSILLVKFGREFLQRPEEPKSAAAPSIPQSAILSGEISILTSRDVLTKAAEGIGPVNLYPELSSIPEGDPRRVHLAAMKMEKDIKVTNLAGSNLLEVVFLNKNPEIAAETVNLVVDAFKEKHLEVFSGAGTPFLENQLKASQARLNSAEVDFADFRKKYGVFAFEEQRTSLIAQRTGIDASLRSAQTQLSELRQKASWTKSSAWMPPSIVEMRAPILALEQRERDLLDKYTSNSRAVQSLRQEMEASKEAVRKNMEILRQAELQRIEGEQSVALARISDLQKQSRQLEAEIQTLDAHGKAAQTLKREVTENEQTYQSYMKKLEESLIMDDMDRRKMAAISVVERAWAGSTKIKQKFSQGQIELIGILGGIGAGVGLAFLLEFMASGMTLPHSAERRLEIPVLVSIPSRKMTQEW